MESLQEVTNVLSNGIISDPASSSPRFGFAPHPKPQSLLSLEGVKLRIQIWPVHSQGTSEQKAVKNFGGCVGVSRDCIFWVPPIISGVSKATNFKVTVGVLKDSKIFRTPIYWRVARSSLLCGSSAFLLVDSTATQYDRLVASWCRPSVTLSILAFSLQGRCLGLKVVESCCRGIDLWCGAWRRKEKWVQSGCLIILYYTAHCPIVQSP